MNNDNIFIKIKKLLEITTDKGATEYEAKTAALMVQKLLAKFNLSIDVVNSFNDEKEIIEDIVDGDKGYLWAKQLAAVVAPNYFCKSFLVCNKIVFYGYKEHISVAKEIFKFLFNTGDKLALELCREYTKKQGHSRDVYNSFVFGYVQGIKEALNEQCVALAIVVPTKVVEEYNKLNLSKAKTRYIREDTTIRDKGYNLGKATIYNRFGKTRLESGEYCE